ncbi:MAG TPA: hypothetical protein VGK22_03810 [Candidatus Angelobacter sp.]|jgi:acetyl-CoA carboxylase beta subunit
MPINKCEHGIYISEGETHALYCSYCTPGGPAHTKDVVLPRSSGDVLSNSDRVTANAHLGGCPECRSSIYMRSNELHDTNRECADCGAKYRVRLTPRQRVMIAREESE